MKPSTWTLLAAAALAVAATRPADAQSKPGKLRTRLAFVGVTDARGPVLDLTAADFQVSEGTVPRTVVRAGLATTPMRVILIVDTSNGTTAAITHIRAGLLALIDELPPDDEIMLVSTGGQNRVRVPPTTDRKKIKDAAGGLFSDSGATILMDGLLEIDDRFVKKAANRWPALVIVTGDGVEGSTGANEKKFSDWIVSLPQRQMSAHAVSIKYRGGGTPELVANHVVQATGGRYEFINTSNSLPEKLKEIGARLAADRKAMATKYEVEFQTDAPDDKPVDIGIARPGGVKIQLSFRRPF